jgi:1-acyl-sn-glycerol-3-phosphate acyltransferase
LRFFVTIAFWAAFGLTAPIAFVLGVLIWLVTLPFDSNRGALHAFICRWTHAYLHLNPFWDTKVIHRDRIPVGAAVIIANHQSMADIVASMGLYRPFKFVSKASLFSLPLVGWLMSMIRYVSVERGRPQSMRQMMDDCRMWLRRGVPVLIYPEGTYSPDGKLLPFKRGAFLLAIEEKVPLVPVLIEGTPGLVHEDGPWLSPRCRIRVTVLEPIFPAELGADDAALTERVRGVYLKALGQGR